MKLELRVTKMNDTEITLSSKEAGRLRWPLSELPQNIKIGDSFLVDLRPRHMNGPMLELESIPTETATTTSPIKKTPPSSNGSPKTPSQDKAPDNLKELLEELLI